MKIERLQAFRKAGVDDATAQAIVESIDRQNDKRFGLPVAILKSLY